MNPLYNQLMGQNAPQQRPVQQPMSGGPQFVRNAIPDLPAEIANDPNKILQYLQQTRGITNEQIQQIAGQIPHF